MKTRKSWIPAVVLIVSLLVSLAALYLPWWSIRTSKTGQITTGAKKTVDYMPSQTVAASEIGSNKSLVISFWDFPENDTTRKSDLVSLFSTTLTVTVVGIVLTALAFALTVISILRKPLFRYAFILAIIGATLLFVAPLYLAAQAPSVLSGFTTVVPPDISVLPGSRITGFWGGAESWMWSAGLGWFLLFTSSLLGVSSAILIRVVSKANGTRM